MSELKFNVPRSLLSNNKMLRRQFLDEYFPSGLIPFEQGIGNEWEITAFTPLDSDYYVDPNLNETLKKWQHPIAIENIGNYRSFYKNSMISFYDSWSVYFWSLLTSFLVKNNEEKPITYTLLHIDDHKDLSSPLIVEDNTGYRSLLTKEKVTFLEPDSIERAISTKSIGIDSFILPLLVNSDTLDIFHIRYAHNNKPNSYNLKILKEADTLLSRENERITLKLCNDPSVYSYSICDENFFFKNKIKQDSIILLHFDCDAFINRYNLDMNWTPRTVSIDLGLSEIKEKVLKLIKNLESLPNPIFVNIALSPGFFPAEHWEEICDFLIITCEKSGIIKNDEFSEYIREKYSSELQYELQSD
ncbi:MAG: hypothetical protein KDK96_09555 [Chlamydiia bacterium]|nr:hypothetical protein [Chlamydiia bacterium]